MQQPVLRVAFTRGVTPAKWSRIWAERRPDLPLELVPTDDTGQLDALRDGEVRLAFVRLPIDRTGLHVIRLYEERPVVLVSRDHVLAAAPSVTTAEVAELGQPVHILGGAIEDTIALVAAGVGAVVVPHSIARLHARKDVVARDVSDGEPTRIALVWMADGIARPEGETADADGLDPSRAAEAIEEFVGIVRGRTASSSRGGSDRGRRPEPTDRESSAARSPSGSRRPPGAAGSGTRAVPGPRPGGAAARGRRKRRRS